MTDLSFHRDDLAWWIGRVEYAGELIAEARDRLAQDVALRDQRLADDRRRGEILWNPGQAMSWVAYWQRLIDHDVRTLDRREREAESTRRGCVDAARRWGRALLEAECLPCETCGGAGVVSVCARPSGCSHVNDSERTCSCQFREDAA